MAFGDHTLPLAEDFTHCARTTSAAETQALGGAMAKLLGGGEIVLLYGNLGAGKTCLVQGICAELVVEGDVVSPTFTLVNTHLGQLTVHHLDFYRIEPGHDLTDVGVPEILDEIWDGDAIGLIEWPGPLVGELGSGPRFELLVETGEQPEERVWYLRGLPGVPDSWLAVFSPKENSSPKGKSAC